MNTRRIKVTFMRFGKVLAENVPAHEGDSILDITINNNLGIDGFGACEGSMACSTCHVILTQEDFDRLPELPVEEEQDMIDIAYGQTDTSRLGCQVNLTAEMDGIVITIPDGINDGRAGGDDDS